MIRLPGLLDAALAETDRLHPTDGSVTLKMIGSSEATLTIAEDAPAVRMHDFISLYTQRGFAGIFRVTNVAQTYKKQIDLTLLHAIDILSDSVWEEQTEFSGTKEQFLRRLLGWQKQLVCGMQPWVLGKCEDTAQYEKSINYDRLSGLLEGMVEEGDDYVFTYDQSVFPWVINYVARDQAVTSEFRLTRNVRSATVTTNDADLCTRLILSVNVRVKDPQTGTESTDTSVRVYDNEAAQAEWGIITKTADVDTKDDIEAKHFPSADAWADHFLRKRAEPSVQIQIDGDELAQMTGDSWDEAAVGRLCQVALVDYGHTFRERVVAVTYPEFLREPQRVSVSLANSLPRFSEGIASVRKSAESAGKSARSAARGAASAKDLTTWSQHVKYYGEALDGTGVMTLYESGIDMDALGGVKIFSLQEGVQALYAGITVNSRSIESVVQSTGVTELGENESLFSRISQEAGRIDLQAERIAGAEGRISSAEIAIDGANAEIALKVNKNGVISAINVSSEEILIQARRINLSGYVTASQLSAELAEINKLLTGVATINKFAAGQGTVSTLYVPTSLVYQGYTVTRKSTTVVTGASLSRTTNTGVNYSFRDYNGEWTTVRVPDSVASVSLHVDTDTIYYIAYA